MGKRTSAVAGRAWRLLRTALSKPRSLFLDPRAFSPSSLKTRGSGSRSHRLHYSEREFSFDDTPAFSFKVRRSASLRLLPCVTPAVDFADDDDEIFFQKCREMRFLEAAEGREEDDGGSHSESESSSSSLAVSTAEEEEEIDSRAEKFIIEFYEQMKLQDQNSNLECNQTLRRGFSC
ncbi:hypothetical protein AXF42_Ash016290 [Apostasia shenzhenica]|uniref:Uncharacterized protein n=1 Tax=Apostasia shenzhenica TaxID=1088818 RepID=A0A2H9ZXC9_9ASPA|nr:hypothetical protein AXF42_Ash016290 [Apostasia shenzhenica]